MSHLKTLLCASRRDAMEGWLPLLLPTWSSPRRRPIAELYTPLHMGVVFNSLLTKRDLTSVCHECNFLEAGSSVLFLFPYALSLFCWSLCRGWGSHCFYRKSRMSIHWSCLLNSSVSISNWRLLRVRKWRSFTSELLRKKATRRTQKSAWGTNSPPLQAEAERQFVAV